MANYKSRALNIFDAADEKQATIDFGNYSDEVTPVQREMRFAYNGGLGTIQFASPLSFWHNSQRFLLGKRFEDLDTALGNEITNRQTAITDEEKARDAAIKVEKDRAELAESGLQGQISNLLSNTDAVALNSLSEIVADYQGAASTAAGRISALETSSATAANDFAAALARIVVLEARLDELTNATPVE